MHQKIISNIRTMNISKGTKVHHDFYGAGRVEIFNPDSRSSVRFNDGIGLRMIKLRPEHILPDNPD